VSKEELIDAVWYSQPASDDSVMQCIKDIRKALGESDRTSVRTIPKRGYLFAAKVEDSPEDPPRARSVIAGGSADQMEALPADDVSAPPPVAPPTGAAPAPMTALPAARHSRERWRSKLIAAGLALGFCVAGASLFAYRQALSEPEVLTMMAAPSVTILPFAE